MIPWEFNKGENDFFFASCDDHANLFTRMFESVTEKFYMGHTTVSYVVGHRLEALVLNKLLIHMEIYVRF